MSNRNNPTRINREKKLNNKKIHSVLFASIFTLITATSGCSTDQTADGKTNEIIDRAQSYFDRGQYRGSLIEARNAVQAEPNNPAARLVLIKNFLALGQTRKAIALLKDSKVTDVALINEYQIILAEAYIQKRKFLSAVKALDKLNGEPTQNEKLKHATLLGESYSGMGRFENAEKQFLAAEAIDPNYPAIASARIVNAFRMKDVREAAKLSRDSLLKFPQDPEILKWAGNLAKMQNDLEGAAQYYTEALANLPNADTITYQKFAILNQLVDTFTKLGKTEESYIYSKVLSQAFPESAGITSKYEEALAAIKLNQLSEAEKTLQELLDKSGGESKIAALLGFVKYYQGDSEGAEALLTEHLDPEVASDKEVAVLLSSNWKMNNQAKILKLLDGELIEKYSNNASIQAIYGMSALYFNQETKGMKALKRAIELKPKQPAYWLALSEYYVKRGRNNSNVEVLSTAHAELPKDLYIGTALVEAYLSQEAADQANKLSQNLLKQFPDSHIVLASAAKAKLMSNDLEQSKEYLNRIISSDEENIRAQLSLGNIAIQEKNFTKAESHYRKAIELNPKHYGGYKGLISGFIQQQSQEKGLRQLKAYATKPENAYAANIALSEFSLIMRKPDAAQSYASEALKANAVSAKAKYLLLAAFIEQAKLELASDGPSAAEKKLTEAKEHGVSNLELLTFLTKTKIAQSKLQEAKDTIQEMEERYPTTSNINTLLGDLNIQKKDYKAAINEYQKAWEKSQSDRAALQIATLSHKHLGLDEAIAFTQAWHTKQPKNVKATFRLATLLQAKGNSTGAIPLYKEVISEQPSNAMALNNLAWIYFETGNASAIDTAANAHRINPKNTNIMDTYGWILVNSNRKAEGIELLEKAVKLAPDSAKLKERLNKAKAI